MTVKDGGEGEETIGDMVTDTIARVQKQGLRLKMRQFFFLQ
jgi:hypothetical protein